SVCNDVGMFRFAAQDIDRAAFQVVFGSGAAEKRSGIGVGDTAASIVLIERALKRPEQEIAFCAVIIDNTQATVGAAVFGYELFAHFCNISDLASYDEELPHLDLCIFLELPRLPHASVQVAFDLAQDRSKLLKVTANGSVGNLFGGADFLTRLYML